MSFGPVAISGDVKNKNAPYFLGFMVSDRHLFYVVLILLYLTIVGGYFYRGIESIQKAKTEGRDVHWWKEGDVVFALGIALLLGGGFLPLAYYAGIPIAFFGWTIYVAYAGIVVMISSFFLLSWRRKQIASPDQEKRE